MIKSPWCVLKGESLLVVKAQCDKCTSPEPPEALHMLVMKKLEGSLPRQEGRLLVCGGTCLQQVNWVDVIFDKPLLDLTPEDIRWMIEQEKVNYTIHREDLLVDFAVAVHRYREDVRFQHY